jgi:hypothetical protein
MDQNAMPAGLRRDGSYYTRIEWVSTTESDPTFWVCNVIDDDLERSGGTWGAHTMGPADLVLSFFGEEQSFRTIKFFMNVGLPISILEELAAQINVYISTTDEARSLRTKDDRIDSVPWAKIAEFETKKEEGWQTLQLDSPVKARYVRFELVKNFGTPPDIPWTELSEIKIYP